MRIFFPADVAVLGAICAKSPRVHANSKVSAQQSNVQWSFTGWSLVFFALGLMSKPMLVTLPFVLLLLDFWPLKSDYDWQCPIRDSASAGPGKNGRFSRCRQFSRGHVCDPKEFRGGGFL